MSLYLRLALTREGAKRLFENRIVDALEHCQFINARPENSLMQLGMYPRSGNRCFYVLTSHSFR